jgi:hypothetical protein
MIKVPRRTPDGNYTVKIVARADGIERVLGRIVVVRANGDCSSPCPNGDGSPPQ